MEKVDRELLIKEISSRLPYGVKAQVLGWDEEKGEVEVPLRIYSINTDGYVYFENNDYDVNYLNVDDCLLYLRPMSSMTTEEEYEYHQCKNIDYLEICEMEHTEMLKTTALCFSRATDWLNKKGFDYRGLIPKGLALEAPEDMYK